MLQSYLEPFQGKCSHDVETNQFIHTGNHPRGFYIKKKIGVRCIKL